MKNIRLFLLFLVSSAICLASITPYMNSALTATPVQAASLNTGASSLYLWGVNISNPNNAVSYVQFFDASSPSSVVLGTTRPAFWYAIPQNGVIDKDIVRGIYFRNGIVIAVTTTPTGSSAPSSSLPTSLFYE